MKHLIGNTGSYLLEVDPKISKYWIFWGGRAGGMRTDGPSSILTSGTESYFLDSKRCLTINPSGGIIYEKLVLPGWFPIMETIDVVDNLK